MFVLRAFQVRLSGLSAAERALIGRRATRRGDDERRDKRARIGPGIAGTNARARARRFGPFESIGRDLCDDVRHRVFFRPGVDGETLREHF